LPFSAILITIPQVRICLIFMAIREAAAIPHGLHRQSVDHSDTPISFDPLSTQLRTRRHILKRGVQLAAVIGLVGTPLAGAIGRGIALSPLWFSGQDGVFRHPINNLQPTYRPESFTAGPNGQRQRHIVRLGDSLADGYTAQRLPIQSIAEKVAIKGHAIGINFLPVDDAQDRTQINYAATQLDELPKQVTPGVPIELMVSTGANDLIMKIDSIKKSLLGLKGHEWRILFEKHEQVLYDAIDDIKGRYRTDILGRIASLRDTGMPIDKVTMIGIPNLAYADLVYDNKEEGIVYHYAPQEGNPIEKRLGASVPYLLNTALADEVVAFHEQTGIEVMLLDTFSSVSPDMMYGFHPTQDGYEELANEFMDKSRYQDSDGSASLREMLLRGRRI
jgi:hypothetical protein